MKTISSLILFFYLSCISLMIVDELRKNGKNLKIYLILFIVTSIPIFYILNS